MWPSRSNKKIQYEKQLTSLKQRQVMIPLMDRGPVPLQQRIAQIQRNLSRPSREKLHKINDSSYIPKLKIQSKFQTLCNNLDAKYNTLSPDSRFYLMWNILLVISIMYNFFELPISIFLTERVYRDQFSSPVWIFINIFLLHVILIDTAVVRWNVGFYEGGELITRRYLILKRYLKYEIYLDTISFIVLLVYISADYRPLVYLKLLFYLKIYSLYKVDKSLMNYLQLHKVFYLVYIFCRIFLTLLFIVVWIAAIYFAIDYHYYVEKGDYYQNSQLWLTDTLSGVDFIQDVDWPYWLLYAAYWASQISATIGYGVGTPRNPITVGYCCFVIVLMTVVFALFINTIWGIISQIQQSSVQYYQSWSSLNKILKQKRISQSLNIRVSEYFHQVWKYNDIKKNSSISQSLSENLKKQLLTLSHLHILHDIPLFQAWERNHRDEWIHFKMKVFGLVENEQLAEGQVIRNDDGNQWLYCILKGRMLVKVKAGEQQQQILYKVNERFGFEQFFRQKPITYTAQADCFTRVAKLSRTNFISCLKSFPTLYFDYVREMETMNFTADRTILGQRCEFCQDTHTPFLCPTKTKWRQQLIRKDLLSLNRIKTLSDSDQSVNEQRKIYRNYVKSQKIHRKKIFDSLQIDRILPQNLQDSKKKDIYLDQKVAYNF